MTDEPPVLRVHAAPDVDTDDDSLPAEMAARLQELDASEGVASVEAAENPAIVWDSDKHDPPGQHEERWNEQYRRYHRWANRRDHEWDLIGFEESTSHEDRLYHHLVFPDLFFTLVSPDASDSPDWPWTRVHNLRGIFPARVAGREITCSDVIDILEGEQEWPTEETTIDDLTSSGSRTHDNWRATLIDAWDRAVGSGWTVDSMEHGMDVSDEPGGRGAIDLVMKSEDGDKFYLVELKPVVDREEIDRAFGQVLRYEELFVTQHQFQNIDHDDVHLAIALPSVPEVYQTIAERYGIQMIDITEALEST